MAPDPLKYPRTPYWPYSPTIGRGDAVHPNPDRFVGCPVVITEKLDGSNVLIHCGKVYSRSVASEAAHKWLAMVKKHHAWKVTEPGILLYGEDIYGVHSIQYGAVRETETFFSFALRNADGRFGSMAHLERYAAERRIPVVPVLHRGEFDSLAELREFIRGEHRKRSALGGDREGVVIRTAEGFPSSDFAHSVCKSVRPNHVRTDRHWTRSWRPCPIRNG